MKLSPTNDVIFKKLFASEENIDILEHLVEDLIGLKLKIQSIKNPYHIDDFVKPEADQLIYTEVDVLAETDTGEMVSVEMQLINHDSFLERTFFYATQAYHRTFANEKLMKGKLKYSSLRHTYAINILNFNPFDQAFQSLAHFEYKERKANIPLSNFGTRTVDLVYLSLNNPNYNNNKIKQWCDFFNEQTAEGDSPSYIEKATDLIDNMTLTEEERKMVESYMTFGELREAELDFAKKKAAAEAAEKAREEGREEGREEQTKKFITLLQAEGYSDDQIATLLDISTADFPTT